MKGKSKERWVGGDFLTAERVILWTDMGQAFIYKLPTKYVFSFIYQITHKIENY